MCLEQCLIFGNGNRQINVNYGSDDTDAEKNTARTVPLLGIKKMKTTNELKSRLINSHHKNLPNIFPSKAF